MKERNEKNRPKKPEELPTTDPTDQKDEHAGTPPEHRKQVTRENTNSRDEVRQQTIAKQGHPK